MKQNLSESFSDSLYHNFIPSFAFVREGQHESTGFANKQVTDVMALYGYVLDQQREQMMEDEVLSLEEILLAEATEGHTSNMEGIYDETSNSGAGTGGITEAEVLGEGELPSEAELQGQTMEELMLAENASVQESEVQQALLPFVPNEMQAQVNLEILQDYEALVSSFYTIDDNTMAGSDQLNVEQLLSADMTISKDSEGPQILIYHTHSQETFADSVPGDASTSIVGVGARLSEILSGQYGYEVLHHTGQYDVDTRDDAYSEALPAIEQVLSENPSIQVIIDLHRDQMPEETKLVMDLNGRPTARFMFFNGLSRTRKTGDISYLYNENLQENLAFSFQMKLKAEEYYPGLTRKNYLKGYRYNMHLKPRTLLVELGAQNNTVEEAMNACDPLAHILDMVLSGG